MKQVIGNDVVFALSISVLFFFSVVLAFNGFVLFIVCNFICNSFSLSVWFFFFILFIYYFFFKNFQNVFLHTLLLLLRFILILNPIACKFFSFILRFYKYCKKIFSSTSFCMVYSYVRGSFNSLLFFLSLVWVIILLLFLSIGLFVWPRKQNLLLIFVFKWPHDF